MPTVDNSVINTVLLAIIGVGGSVLILRYIHPILSTQEKHRQSQDREITRLGVEMAAQREQSRVEMAAQREKNRMLEEMVTQRAQVDDLRQFVKVAVDDNMRGQRRATEQADEHHRQMSVQHEQHLALSREMVAALQAIERRLIPEEWTGSERRRAMRGPAGPAGPAGERGEKGDHGQDAGA